MKKNLVHRGLGFELPPGIARLDAYIRARSSSRRPIVDRALGIAYLDSWVGQKPGRELDAASKAGELGYTGHPFEIVPFAWQGGDALQFAMMVHDAELAPTSTIVSFAPGDDAGPRWLGNDADEAIANLMGIALRDGALAFETEEERKEASDEVAGAVRDLSSALRLAPNKNVRAFTRGARSKKDSKPAVPAGWRWVPTTRGMGVLAPKKQFDPSLGKHVLPKRAECEPELARARAAMQRGFPASALTIARQVYATHYDERNLAAAEVMRAAYEALGRHFLVARVDAYLVGKEAANRKPKKKR